MTVGGQPTVSYAYDAGNRLTQITQAAGAVNNNSAQTVGFAYDADNRLIQKTLTNGIAMHYSYDNANRLTGIIYAQGQNTIGNLTYGYDAAGRRVATGGTFARRAPTPASTSAVDAANRLSTFNGVTMQYDANGNLLSDGTNTYNWNARNQLVQITGGSTSTFTYDALGRRQSVTINGVASNYVYDGLNIVGELNTGTTYLTGLGVDQMLAMETSNGAQIASYLTDALGSTIRLTDQNGSKLVDYTYSLYGATNADASIVNPFQYAGRENG
jgi:YD repeat-containing protein